MICSQSCARRGWYRLNWAPPLTGKMSFTVLLWGVTEPVFWHPYLQDSISCLCLPKLQIIIEKLIHFLFIPLIIFHTFWLRFGETVAQKQLGEGYGTIVVFDIKTRMASTRDPFQIPNPDYTFPSRALHYSLKNEWICRNLAKLRKNSLISPFIQVYSGQRPILHLCFVDTRPTNKWRWK